ncbi:DNA topoisomerase 2-alpha-like [Argiope bruennichi]|uniref:DNA topoisomerase 2 n=1 Tax=Argiope bruennichi TaxID=94029 RepID=A0A8T0EEM5_ARGBR|nr:DNA topoisomerase 2-alpha-like [Argiope bruennichi]KAF8771269.1 DNA topoisomerase 2-alpha like protein [Argiope bruennichi]
MADSIEMDGDWEIGDIAAKAPKGNKKLSVERIYQKKTQLEHILLRPDTYIGSVEPVTQTMWVYDDGIGLVNREVTYVPGLYKIFDEILVNAADNKQRDKSMDMIKIEINPEKNKICIWNNGRGIPVVEHKDEKMFVPSLIFGHLLTSSNYNDEERKVTGGRNGYGAKLCNIFSTKFTVETASKEYHKQFKQTWKDNMTKAEEPKIQSFNGSDFTCITFYPDLAKFKMTVLDKDIVAIMTRRAYDIAGCARGVKVILNDKRLPIKTFKDYISLYLTEKTDENGDPLKIVHEAANERWEIAVTLSSSGYQHVSFVNSIATTKGGRHVDYITDQLTSKIAEVIKKKNKGGKDVKPFQIKSHLWVFVNCLIENPTFDSQTKENMTLQIKNFGSKCQLSEKFVNQAMKCGVVESIMSWIRFKAQTELEKKCSGKKHTKLRGIPKLEDANDAGTRNSIDCTLILTEGDSAKSLAVSGLGVVGRDKYGVFPLKGKILNVREASHKQILENAEINNIIKIMGLQYKKKYESVDDLKTLRYGRLMIMTDQDQDGSHIKGLLINFIHHNWPSLLRLPFLEEFITPIVKATKGKEEKCFYSLPEFEEWKTETPNWNKYKVKYYKGLGTSTAKEAKEYFSDMKRHRIRFHYTGTEDDNAIQLAFSKKMVDMRKEWLTNGMEERKRRRELGLPELYLYGKDTTAVTYNDFVNKELILFSNMDNERSIPSAVDGFKPGQRKVLFTCLKRNDKREVKVAQLVGSVAEQSAYHHGEQALAGTIIGLAQDFVGSNNINVLLPVGQFGTRLQGGKDAASPRYIFTMLSPVTKHLFSSFDSPLLNHLYDDNLKIEPEYYVPIIPMVLVNGAEGIGTGWSTKVPNYNPRDLVKNIYRLLDGEEPLPMNPWYKNFRGQIDRLDDQHFLVSGEIAILEDNKIEITELPIRTWTQTYKENVLEPMVHGTDKTPAFITDYKEYHTDTTVRFVIKMTPDKFQQARNQGLHKAFKLQTSISLSSMVLFDHLGCLRKYDSPEQILKEFYEVRFALYEKRKDYMVGALEAESLKLKNQARFIIEKCDNKISVENRRKAEMIKLLQDRGYDSDPLKAWKESQKNIDEEKVDEESDTEKEDSSSGPDYDYLLGMTLWSLTREKKDELLKKRDEKIKELNDLKSKSASDLWRNDLKEFLEELDKFEKEQQEDESGHSKLKKKTVGKKKYTDEDKPSPFGERVNPPVDEEFKKKWEKKPSVPGEGRKGRKKKLPDIKEEDGDDNKEVSLSERVVSTTPEKKQKGKGTKNGTKQAALSFKTIGEKKGATKSPKKSKRNPWSDSESNDDISDLSDMDDKPEDYIPAEKREMAPRRAAAKTKYNFDSDDNDMNSNSDNESREPSPVPASINHRNQDVEEKLNGNVSSDLSDVESNPLPPLNSKGQSNNDLFDSLLGNKASEESPEKSTEIRKNVDSDSDSSSGFKIEVEKPAPKAAPKKRARKASDESSDDDFKPKPKKEAKAKKPAAPRKKSAPKEGGGVAKKPSKPKAKPKKKSGSDDDFGASDNDDAPESQPARQPRAGRTKAPTKFTFDSDSDDDF